MGDFASLQPVPDTIVAVMHIIGVVAFHLDETIHPGVTVLLWSVLALPQVEMFGEHVP